MMGRKAAGRLAPASDGGELPRARGEVVIALGRRGRRTVALDVGQAGCGRVRFPRRDHPAVEAVLINTAGGLTDGDRLRHGLALGEGTALTATSQAAEKVYRSRGEPAEVLTSLRLADGAALAWLPQETILFDRARLVRRLRADLTGSARLLACESLVFGRVARGERLREGLIHDAWRVYRDGRLVWADGFRLEGDIEARLARPALLDGGHALATAVYVGQDAGGWLEPVRGCLEVAGIRAGASHRSGVLVMRLIAEAAERMRAVLASVLPPLRAAMGAGPAAMPGVWAC